MRWPPGTLLKSTRPAVMAGPLVWPNAYGPGFRLSQNEIVMFLDDKFAHIGGGGDTTDLVWCLTSRGTVFMCHIDLELA